LLRNILGRLREFATRNPTVTNDTQLESHYPFGRNWARFAAQLDESRIDHAVAELERLVPCVELAGRPVLDVGSGSGLSSLAALRLGAARVVALDLDPDSVATTRAVLDRFAPGMSWEVREQSAFDLDAAALGRFDVVHSWGVLHHTGALWRAVDACLPLVEDGGLLVLALYRKTPACGFWRAEKRFYSRSPGLLRALVRGLYKFVFVVGLIATGRSPAAYVRNFEKNRGMAWTTDVDDWLGGYPYESVTPEEVRTHLLARGFDEVRSFTKPVRLGGLLGSHCDEFAFRKNLKTLNS
jgi:2-polyprenyl-6-hydroxyphenyl methylase/3-demethylubiquinone-9 3-methyltransferase